MSIRRVQASRIMDENIHLRRRAEAAETITRQQHGELAIALGRDTRTGTRDEWVEMIQSVAALARQADGTATADGRCDAVQKDQKNSCVERCYWLSSS